MRDSAGLTPDFAALNATPAEPRRLERKTFPPRLSTRRITPGKDQKSDIERTEAALGGALVAAKVANSCEITTLFRLLYRVIECPWRLAEWTA